MTKLSYVARIRIIYSSISVYDIYPQCTHSITGNTSLDTTKNAPKDTGGIPLEIGSVPKLETDIRSDCQRSSRHCTATTDLKVVTSASMSPPHAMHGGPSNTHGPSIVFGWDPQQHILR